MNNYEEIGKNIGALVDKKNKAYGNSFSDVESFIKMIFPEKINVDNYGDAIFIIRLFDKMKRLATDKNAFNEDVYKDIIGLAVRLYVLNNPESCGEKQWI